MLGFFAPPAVALTGLNPLAYVTNSLGDTLSLVDPRTKNVIWTMPIGVTPVDVAVNRAGTRVYVTDDGGALGVIGDGQVTVIETSSYAVVARVKFGAHVRYLSVTPDGARIYVGYWANPDGPPLPGGLPYGGNIAVIDAATNAIITTIPTNPGTSPLAANPAGRYVYATAPDPYHPGNVLVIDTATNAIVKTIPVGGYPWSIVFHPAGTFAYVATGAGVEVIDAVSHSSTGTIPLPSGGSGLGMLTVNPAGTLLYAVGFGTAFGPSQNSSGVWVLDLATNAVVATIPLGTTSAGGIAMNPAGTEVWVTDDTQTSPDDWRGHVLVIDTATNTVVGSPIGVGIVPGMIAFGPASTSCPSERPNGSYAVDLTQQLVLDGGTTLLWKQCAEGQSGAACSGTAAALTWAGALNAAAGSTFAGYTDWRLPNAKELESLVQTGCFAPTIDKTSFPSTAPQPFWSSTTYAADPTQAWSVDFASGSTEGSAKGGTANVRLVRSGQLADSFDRAGITLAPPSVTTARVGVPYSSALVAQGGMPPYTFSIVSGALPAGLVLNSSTGGITGTPTAAGPGVFTARVQDSASTPGVALMPCRIAMMQLDIAYVLGSGGLTAIDVASNTASGTVAGVYGNSLVVDPSGARVYVASLSGPGPAFSSGIVRVFDTATNAVTATIPLNFQPTGIAVNAAGTRLYVANNYVDYPAPGNHTPQITIIDVTTNHVITSVLVVTPGLAQGIAVNPAGTRVYFLTGGYGPAVIHVLDTATNTVIANTTVGYNANNIVVNSAGTKAYVSNTSDGTVSVMDLGTNAVTATVPLDFGTDGCLALRPDGSRLYVVTRNGNPFSGATDFVKVVDTASNTIVATIPISASRVWAVYAIAVTPAGDRAYLLADTSVNGAGTPNTVYTIDLATNTLGPTITTSGGIEFAIVVSAAGAGASPAPSVTTTAIFASNNPSFPGQPLTLTAAIVSGTSPAPALLRRAGRASLQASGRVSAGASLTGAVQFLDAGAPLGTSVPLNGGTASLTIQTSSLTVGTHPISASYTGDATNQASTSAVVNVVVSSAAGPPGPKLLFGQQPTGAAPTMSIVPAVTVQLANGSGSPIAFVDILSPIPTTVTIALTSGTGTLSGTLVATTDASGLATFSGLSINVLGAKQLTATAPGLTSTVSNAFSIASADNAPSAVPTLSGWSLIALGLLLSGAGVLMLCRRMS
jgi:YVTN family beta-propeller protein